MHWKRKALLSLFIVAIGISFFTDNLTGRLIVGTTQIYISWYIYIIQKMYLSKTYMCTRQVDFSFNLENLMNNNFQKCLIKKKKISY